MTPDRLTDIVAATLKIPADTVDDGVAPENTPSWDSLAAMELVSQIEDAFSVSLTTREIMRMRNVGLIREALRARGVVGV